MKKLGHLDAAVKTEKKQIKSALWNKEIDINVGYRHRKQLKSGSKNLGQPLSEDDQEKLFVFVQLIIKWNKIHNLTAITETKEIISKHLLDSLSVSRYLYGQSIIDVGTGAGLPGIPLAVANPDKAFTLLDSSQKKIALI